MVNIRKTSKLILLACAAALAGLFLHEAGHGLTALAYGGRITDLAILPGLQLYPRLRLIGWDGGIATIGYVLPAAAPFPFGLVALMGSGTTALVAVIALLAAHSDRARGTTRLVCLTVAALFPLDIVTYSVFPALGLRHWIVLGGRVAEPLEGARLMGVSDSIFFTLLALYTALMYGGLAAFWNREGLASRLQANLQRAEGDVTSG